MSKIFVTGATGVVGRLAVPAMLRLGHEVTAAGRNPDKLSRLRAAGANAVTVDLFDAAGLRRAVDGHDVVVNLATHIPGSMMQMSLPWAWRENDRVRRDGSTALAGAAIAAGASRFIQESFAPIYEDGGGGWIDEQHPVRPTRYNRTTLDAEGSAARITGSGRAGVVLRFAAFYGNDPMLREMLGVIRRGWSPLPGDAGAFWSSVSHEDAASAVVAALDAPPGIYNVCDDEPLTRREWVDAAADAAGLSHPKLLPHWLAALGGPAVALLSRSQRMSNARFKRATGWQPRWTNARAGLTDALREARSS